MVECPERFTGDAMTNQVLKQFSVKHASTEGSDALGLVSLTVQWQVEHAQVRLAGHGGGVLTSVAWHVREGVATATARDADGRTMTLASEVPLRESRAGRYIHADSSDGRLHLTVELTGQGGCKLMYIATDLLTTLGVAGGRAEWPVLVSHGSGELPQAGAARAD